MDIFRRVKQHICGGISSCRATIGSFKQSMLILWVLATLWEVGVGFSVFWSQLTAYFLISVVCEQVSWRNEIESRYPKSNCMLSCIWWLQNWIFNSTNIPWGRNFWSWIVYASWIENVDIFIWMTFKERICCLTCVIRLASWIGNGFCHWKRRCWYMWRWFCYASRRPCQLHRLQFIVAGHQSSP